MAISSLGCPTCGAAVDANDTTTPTIKCRYCNTVMKNPFYNSDRSSDRVAMPIINVNIGGNIPTTPGAFQQPQPAQPYYAQQPPPPPPYYAPYPIAPPAPTESSRHWVVTFFLALFLGWFGVHRFYTGHIKIGLVQLFTFGGLGLWMVIDILLIITGVYKDNKGLTLSGRRSKKIVLLGFGLLMFSCIGFVAWVETASKVDLPSERAWITGIDRCPGSSAYGQLVLPDKINLWQSWRADRGTVVGMVSHKTPVKVLEGRESVDDIVFYRVETEGGLKGWISAEFIQFQPLSDGIVPREDC